MVFCSREKVKRTSKLLMSQNKEKALMVLEEARESKQAQLPASKLIQKPWQIHKSTGFSMTIKIR